MIKHRSPLLPPRKERPSNNQFLFEQHPLTFEKPEFRERLSIKNTCEEIRKEESRDRLPNRTHLQHNMKLKTESNGRLPRRMLPDLLKTPLNKMKNSQLQKSEKVIRSSCKNTQILNELIGILQEGSEPQAKLNSIKVNKIKKKGSFLQEAHSNEFLLEEKEAISLHWGPKVIPTTIMKLYDQNPVARRNIYSEECSRALPKKYSIKSNKCTTQPEELLTFYNVKQRAYTEAVQVSREDALQSSTFQF